MNIEIEKVVKTLNEMKEWIKVNRKWKEKSLQNLLLRWKVNVWLPLLFLKYQETGNSNLGKIISLYQHLPSEMNHIVTMYTERFLKPKNAWESQGIMELERYFCSTQNCLSCPVGKFLLKRSLVSV